jgi:hypothetical protein
MINAQVSSALAEVSAELASSPASDTTAAAADGHTAAAAAAAAAAKEAVAAEPPPRPRQQQPPPQQPTAQPPPPSAASSSKLPPPSPPPSVSAHSNVQQPRSAIGVHSERRGELSATNSPSDDEAASQVSVRASWHCCGCHSADIIAAGRGGGSGAAPRASQPRLTVGAGMRT